MERAGISAHECALLDEELGWLRRLGADIPPTPEVVRDLLALADRVSKDDALWAALPGTIQGWSKSSLRKHIQGKVQRALS